MLHVSFSVHLYWFLRVTKAAAAAVFWMGMMDACVHHGVALGRRSSSTQQLLWTVNKWACLDCRMIEETAGRWIFWMCVFILVMWVCCYFYFYNLFWFFLSPRLHQLFCHGVLLWRCFIHLQKATEPSRSDLTQCRICQHELWVQNVYIREECHVFMTTFSLVFVPVSHVGGVFWSLSEAQVSSGSPSAVMIQV